MLLTRRGRSNGAPFDEVCTVLYVSKTLNEDGERVEGPILPGDLVVIGFIKGIVNFRGIVSYEALMTFSVNILQRGHKYRFISNRPPEFGGNFHGTLALENIVPHRSIKFRLLSLFGF